MTDTQTPSDPDASHTEALDPREARAARRLARLERLSEIGMALAEVAGRRVSAAVEAGGGESLDTGAAAVTFSRVAMAVRQLTALEARLDQDCAALAVRVKAERTEAEEAAVRRRDDSIEYTAGCVTEAVEELADALAKRDPDDDRPERLLEVMTERLDDPREMDDIWRLPVSVLIERICKTAGVTPEWSLWEREDWAVAEWKDATPGSPYAAHAQDRAVREDRGAAPAPVFSAPDHRTAIPPDPGGAFIREHGPPSG